MKKTLYMILAMLLTLSLCLTACNDAQQPGTTAGTTETTETTISTEATLDSDSEEDEDWYDEEGWYDDEDRYGDEDDLEEYYDPDSDVEIGITDDDSTDDESADGETTDGETSAAEDGDTFAGDTVTSNPQGSAKNLTWANINSFAIKSSSMSVSQLRKLCVDFFRFSKTALWTPDESISFERNSKGTADSMTGGSLYGGLPYVSLGSGNVYRMMDYINESNGKVDMSDALNLTGGKLSTAAMKYFGNQCSLAAQAGWGRVINSTSGFYTENITKANGYIPLGSYKYNTTKVRTWNTTYGTDECCRENGEQIMYHSYAELQPADGLVYYTTAGHVVMAATAAHVEYVSGTNLIDGSKSYVTIIDQAQTWGSYTTSGKTYQMKNSVDAKVTFKQLFNNNYVPFTFAEWTGDNGIEATTCSFSHTGSSITKDQLFSAKATSNYSITDAYAIVTDASGREVYKHAVRNGSAFSKNLNMKASGDNVDSWGTLASGTYTVKVVLQLATGERPTVYTGTLTV